MMQFNMIIVWSLRESVSFNKSDMNDLVMLLTKLLSGGLVKKGQNELWLCYVAYYLFIFVGYSKVI